MDPKNEPHGFPKMEGKMAAENAEASALAELGGAGHPTRLKARAVEPLICCKTKEE